jgi:hypothetical protein
MARSQIKREALYDLVWEKPMVKVAEQFGLSDRGMAKLCDRHDIPVPPRGYWARKQAGQKMRKPALKKRPDNMGDTILIYGSEQLPEGIQQVVKSARQKISPTPAEETHDPLSLDDLHPAVKATAKSLRNAKPDKEGAVKAELKSHCGVNVGKESSERAILILHRLAQALDQQNLRLQPAGQNMKVAKGQDEVCITFKEHIRRQKHVPTEEEKEKERELERKHQEKVRRNRGFDLWFMDRERAYPEYDYIRTGEFGIELQNGWVQGARKTWNDGKTQRLEKMADDIALGIVAYLEGLKLHREEREQRERNYQEAARRREIQRRWNEREDRRLEFAKNLSDTIQKINELERLLENMNDSKEESPEITRMKTWISGKICELRSKLNHSNVSAALSANNLFPEIDEMSDG